MKILFVCGNLSNGGAQRVISRVSGGLYRLGNEVFILAFSRTDDEYEILDGIKIDSLADSQEEYDSMPLLARLGLLRRKIRMIAPDAAVGFLQGGYALFLASMGMDFVKIATIRIDPDVLFRQKGIRGFLDKQWFGKSAAIVAQTKKQKDKLAGWLRKKTYVIPNPADTETAAEHDYERKFRRIIMIGRLEPQKNYGMALRAMKKVSEQHGKIVLDIFGSGTLEDVISNEIKRMGLQEQVYLKGWSRDVAYELTESDAYILTSDYEGMPNSLMEAMSLGLPCISANCETGPSELIEDGKNGFLTEVNDSEQLATLIIKLSGMIPAERKRIGQAAKKSICENFGIDKVSEMWRDVLLECCSKKS